MTVTEQIEWVKSATDAQLWDRLPGRVKTRIQALATRLDVPVASLRPQVERLVINQIKVRYLANAAGGLSFPVTWTLEDGLEISIHAILWEKGEDILYIWPSATLNSAEQTLDTPFMYVNPPIATREGEGGLSVINPMGALKEMVESTVRGQI